MQYEAKIGFRLGKDVFVASITPGDANQKYVIPFRLFSMARKIQISIGAITMLFLIVDEIVYFLKNHKVYCLRLH